jgi:hypothetical protein
MGIQNATARCGLVLFALILSALPAMAECPAIFMKPQVQAQARQIIGGMREQIEQGPRALDVARVYSNFANGLNRWLLSNGEVLRFRLEDSRQVNETLRNRAAAVPCFSELGPLLKFAEDRRATADREAKARAAEQAAQQNERIAGADREAQARAAQQAAQQNERIAGADREAKARAAQQAAQQQERVVTAPPVEREAQRKNEAEQKVDVSQRPTGLTSSTSSHETSWKAWLPEVVRENFGQSVFILWGLIVLAAFFLSLSGRATIYRDLGDVGFTSIVLALFAIGVFYGQTELLGPTALILSACGAGVVVLLTFRDNHNPLYAIIASITKLSLSALFVLLAIGALFPGGNTNADQRADRAKSLTLLAILSPLIYALIRDNRTKSIVSEQVSST